MNESVTVWVWDYFICSFQIMSLSRLLSAEYLPSLPHSVTLVFACVLPPSLSFCSLHCERLCG